MLARRHLGEAPFLPQGLHLQEGEQRTHLILDALEADQAVQLSLELVHRPCRCGWSEVLELRDAELGADRSERLPSVLKRIARHGRLLVPVRPRGETLPADRSAW